jgi:integrative and conjugative element protein (TIGR02256 family)
MNELRAVHESFEQEIIIEGDVMRYLARHRQRHFWNLEAGGQLFGSISPQSILISNISGPYPRDDRGPRHYRSHPQSAQTEIKRQQKLGHLYLGEWHSHAEKKPRASGDDNDAMQRLMRKSTLATNGLLLIITGQHESGMGTSVYSHMDGALREWDIVIT